MPTNYLIPFAEAHRLLGHNPGVGVWWTLGADGQWAMVVEAAPTVNAFWPVFLFMLFYFALMFVCVEKTLFCPKARHRANALKSFIARRTRVRHKV